MELSSYLELAIKEFGGDIMSSSKLIWVTCKSVWLRINSCESKQEELSIYNTSQLCSKLLDFSI